MAQLNANKANKSAVHDLKGTNANLQNSSLLQWASDEAKRLSIWKILGNSVTGFPDDSVEWCALNLQDASGDRGIVVAFRYSDAEISVKYRCYNQSAWYGTWKTIV
ncbi:hypothetical protein AALB39_28795 [Lachnospiraceae bacterium 54-53]